MNLLSQGSGLVSVAAIAPGDGRRHKRCDNQRLEQHNWSTPAHAPDIGASHVDCLVAAFALQRDLDDARFPDELDHGTLLS